MDRKIIPEKLREARLWVWLSKDEIARMMLMSPSAIDAAVNDYVSGERSYDGDIEGMVSAITEFESGARSPSDDEITRFSMAYGISVDSLCGEVYKSSDAVAELLNKTMVRSRISDSDSKQILRFSEFLETFGKKRQWQ